MMTSTASLLGGAYALSELALMARKRAKSGESRVEDKGSLNLIWIVIVTCVTLAFNLAYLVPEAAMNAAPALRRLGIALFAAGIALRWYAIVHLGRFFTVNVAVAADHRLIDTGPYRIIRHPSYTGALMAFLGLGLCMANWASLLCLLVPICLVFLWRIHVEETVLLQALGDQYRNYMQRTKRLIPAVF
jgi:protein-S-isoprenylcysteine O-methyltransferase